MKQRIVLMKSQYDTIVSKTCGEDDDLEYWENSGYTVITEPVEVDFPDLSHEEVVRNEIAVIDKKIKSVMAESESTINKLKEKKQELLALTYEG